MLLDNKKNGKVGDALREHLTEGTKLSVISGLFSIYGFESLKNELKGLDRFRLVLAQEPANDMADGMSAALAGDEFELRFRNRLDQNRIAKECAKWLAEKADIKVAKNPRAFGQNLLLAEGKDGEAIGIQGSSTFTSTGFGYSESNRFHMNMCAKDAPSTQAMLDWFETIWNDPAAVEDAKAMLLERLEKLVNDQTPEFIYFLTLYNIFKDFLEDIDEENIIKSKTGFKDTIVWNKLYKFQRDGVLGAIDKLEKYNGCIIADSVGLGKTFEALAVIKYYELRNDRVLVLCPKKLRDNWTVYTVNDKRNLLASDRFNYDVLNHTDLTRLQGRSGEINLETLNWGNYDLVVIDESHNFRNSSSAKEGLTRYSRLMDEIIRSGVKTKVLMLSATPVNNRMNDLKNQVAFITEGIDSAYSEQGIGSVEETLRKAQTRFNNWLRHEESERTVEALLDSMNFDYFKLLDLLTIARSRKHIEKYYDVSEIGSFPERLQPINIKADIDTLGQFPPLREINRTIRKLNLSAYSPLKYVRADKREEYSRKYDVQVKGGQSVFRQIDREQSLIHLMRVNLLKRMESSINSFGLTLEKLLGEVESLLEKLENHSASDIEELGIEDVETDDPEFDAYLIGRKVKVLIKDIDEHRWRQDLKDDRTKLAELLEEARKIEAARDAKLHGLRDLIADKCNNPINAGNRKIVVFTAFSDTANYLYENIAGWAKDTLGINAAQITGSGTNKTNMPGQSNNFDSLLAAFSPFSKERSKIDEGATEEIDLLIATDCISEGQNLQDCDFLVNYDIHWNPVRIIQRFGRIDRLGSKNEVIQLVNFWPNMELDEYINLEARVSGRMVLLDISATGEENVIEQDSAGQMKDLEYRRKQLEQLQKTVVDLEDMSGGVSIADLTLNDFRMDLSAFMKEHLDELESAPTGLFAAATLDHALKLDGLPPGVVFCLKNVGKPVRNDDGYALAPYYLAYVSDDGQVALTFTQSKKVLDVLKKHGLGTRSVDKDAVARMNARTKNGRDMSHYRALLEAAVASVVGKSEEKGVESLFSRGGTNLTKDSFQCMEDFEVISYMVVNAP
ncbi:SNF2 domain-containing protein [Rhodovulum bhavnagarense]|uniref:SNF2 domain-containing protein n=1 Tax=Rhodovulum bhavnagarense TaxID=992286 RepID=A0A4R2REH4_9RHOB|nr:helicase-related protein [Rhodovulum bhavnagarense]TCP60649.1 SNF2 domain-containing protein [Rhodovulum bhavnagarense]